MKPPHTLRADPSLLVLSRVLPESRVGPQPAIAGPAGLIEAVLTRRAGTWLGLPAASDRSNGAPYEAGTLRCRPVGISAAERAGWLDGFARQAIWPLYHHGVQPPKYLQRWWAPYDAVNRRFAAAAAAVAARGGTVWVHDHELQLVPAYLRRRRPDLAIGFFLHTPFPPVELFARLPWRRQVLAGLLGADSIGFQTEDDALRFAETARRLAAARGAGLELEVGGRPLQLVANPVGIDARQLEALARRPDVQSAAWQIRQSVAGRRLLLGVDRLDGASDLEAGLRAFGAMLARDPSLADRVAMIQLAVPNAAPGGAAASQGAERIAECITARHGAGGPAPVRVVCRDPSSAELAAYFLACDALVVGALCDGAAVGAKEFVATRIDEGGVLVLSEFAGAADELAEAIRVNPYDGSELRSAFEHALRISPDEARRRMVRMRVRVRRHDVHAWADRCLEALLERHGRRFARSLRSPLRIAAVAAEGSDAV